MDNLSTELRDILKQHAPDKLYDIKQDACWLDHRACPYGLPNGRFQDRPQHFCHLGNHGCPRLGDLKETADVFMSNVLQGRIEEAVEKESVTLASEVEVVAEDEKVTDALERATLLLAAKIISSHSHLNKKIIRVDDI